MNDPTPIYTATCLHFLNAQLDTPPIIDADIWEWPT